MKYKYDLLNFLVNGHSGGFGGISNKLQIIILNMLWATPLRSRFNLSNNYKFYQECLDRDGFVIIPDIFNNLAKRINDDLSKNKTIVLRDRCDSSKKMLERAKNLGSNYFYDISLNSAIAQDLYANEHINKLIFNHFRRQHYMRENPYLFEARDIGLQKDIVEEYHIDQLNQLSMVMLLNDVDTETTHMEIKIGSKNVHWNYDRYSLDQDKLKLKYNSFKCIGPQGTVYLFNAGRVFHKGVIKPKKRLIMHCNYTTGYNTREPLESLNFLDDKSNYIKKAFSKINKIDT